MDEEVVRALAREIALLSHEVAALRHRQNNIFRPGTVEAVRAGEYRARVRLADGQQSGQGGAEGGGQSEPFLSPWRPWSSVAGAKSQDWTPLEAGQQVLLFSPTGVLGQSLILPFGFSDETPPPASSADHRLFRYGGSRMALRDGDFEIESGRVLLKGETRTDGETRLGSPEATKRVLLEDGSPATKVFGI